MAPFLLIRVPPSGHVCGKAFARTLVTYVMGSLGGWVMVPKSFWYKWASVTSFNEMLGPLSNSLSGMHVNQFIANEKTWNIDSLNQILPQHLVDQVIGIPIVCMQDMEDKQTWYDSPSRCYSAKHGFKWLTSFQGSQGEWKWIWKLPIPPNL